MQFLTDGKTFLGPYGDDEIQSLVRARRTLIEVHEATNVYAIKAENDESARRTWARSAGK